MEGDEPTSALQGVLQQRNFLKYVCYSLCSFSVSYSLSLCMCMCVHVCVCVCVCVRNLNPRDPLNINLRKAFLEYDKTL